jgi:hypothetical protein
VRHSSLGEEFQYRAKHSRLPTERRAALGSLTNTLIERVDRLVQPSKPPLEWGSPLLSTTPTSVAIRELAERTEALANAVREIALEVQKLSNNGQT